MTVWTRRRSRAILLVLIVVALATAGVVYAHWTDTLQVNAQVNTGSVGSRINAASTDDDGTQNGWEGAGDNGGGTEYDRWGLSSSNDPSNYRGVTRYTKDVARCRVTGTVGTTSTVEVENAYPSYHCSIYQNVTTMGSVPMKNQATRVYACGPGLDCSDPTNWVTVPYVKATNSFSYDSGDGDLDFELVMQDNPGGTCGYQFDPGFNYGSFVTFHVLQDAEQGSNYSLRFVVEQVNWNEWSLAACTGFRNQIQP
jgi:predicted ribosomally synthesized peptide with SipW-like signal peptide